MLVYTSLFFEEKKAVVRIESTLSIDKVFDFFFLAVLFLFVEPRV